MIDKYTCKRKTKQPAPFSPTREHNARQDTTVRTITKTCLFKYTENFTTKKWKFTDKKSIIFFIFLLKNIDCGYSLEPPRLLKNIDCGYSLEPPRWGGSNEYPQSMFLSRNTHNLCFWAEIRKKVYPCNPQFYYIKVGFKGVNIV